jgi:hypothetical protein
MRSYKLSLILLGVVALVAAPTFASTVLFQDDFETGTPGSAPGAANPGPGTWSFLQAKGFEFVANTNPPGGAGGSSQFMAIGASSGWSESDAVFGHQAVGDHIRLEVDVLGASGSQPMIYGNDYNPTEKDGFYMYFVPSSNVVGTSGSGTATYNAGWNHVQMDYVVGGTTFDLYVNGTPVLNQAVAGTYDGTIDTFAFASAAGNGCYDNVKITNLSQTVPEPTSIALLISAVLGLVAYAWRKRR